LWNSFEKFPRIQNRILVKKADGHNLKSFIFSIYNFFPDLWDEAEGYVIKAKDIFEVMFGKDYPLLTQKWKPIQIQIDQRKTTS
jgi:hypothetical protein